MGSANGRNLYILTSFIIGQAHTQNDPCYSCFWLKDLASMARDRRIPLKMGQ